MKITTRKDNGMKQAEVVGPAGRQRISLGTRSAKEAAKIAKNANLAELEHASKANSLTAATVARLSHGRRQNIRALLDRWVADAPYRAESVATTDSNRKSVMAWLEKTDLLNAAPASLLPSHLFDYINAEDSRSASTRSRQLGAIRPFLSYVAQQTHAIDAAILTVRVNLRAMPHAQREAKQQRAFTAVEQDTILEYLEQFVGETADDAFWFFASHFARAAGLRLGDVAQLEWDSIGQPGHLIVWTDKRDTRVCLPINERITPGLRKVLPRLQSSDDRYVFPEQAARYETVSKRPWFSVTYGRILARLQIEDASFHSWRHTALTRWDAAGFSLEECAVFAGHNGTESTKGYIHK